MDIFQLKKVVDIIEKYGDAKQQLAVTSDAKYNQATKSKIVFHKGNEYEAFQETCFIENWEENRFITIRTELRQHLIIRYDLLSFYEKISWTIGCKKEISPQHKIKHPKLALKAIYSLIRKYA